MVTNTNKMPASTEAFVDGEGPRLFGGTGAASPVNGLDYAEILRSAGEAAYEWRMESDHLIWSDNAPAVFGLRNDGPIASGRAYADLFDSDNGKTRFDVIFQSQETDRGSGGSDPICAAHRCALAQALGRGYRPLVRRQ